MIDKLNLSKYIIREVYEEFILWHTRHYKLTYEEALSMLNSNDYTGQNYSFWTIIINGTKPRLLIRLKGLLIKLIFKFDPDNSLGFKEQRGE